MLEEGFFILDSLYLAYLGSSSEGIGYMKLFASIGWYSNMVRSTYITYLDSPPG